MTERCSRFRTTSRLVQEGVDHEFSLPSLLGSVELCYCHASLAKTFHWRCAGSMLVCEGEPNFCVPSLSHDKVSSSTCVSIWVLFFRRHSGILNVTGACLRRPCPHFLSLLQAEAVCRSCGPFLDGKCCLAFTPTRKPEAQSSPSSVDGFCGT